MTSSLWVAELLAPFRADPEGTAVLSDFDGTLAPIVADPAAARPLPGVVDTLAALARHYGRVGVVSGRPASFLVTHLGGRGLFLSGMYGLEMVPDGGSEVRAVAEAEPWRAVVEQAVAAGASELPPGIDVEGKGLSLTVHYRGDPGRAPEAEAWIEAQARATGLVVHAARMSYELRPPVERDKGTVVADLAAGRGQVCFLGDDRGDLSAFDALDRLAATGVSAVRIGVSSEEAPAELLDRADLVVDGPEGALAVLRALIDDP